MTDRLSILPDTDGEVAHHLGRLEEVLLLQLRLQPYEGYGQDKPERVQWSLGGGIRAW